MSSIVEDRPTIQERYSSAASSSNLAVKEGHCDVDLLMAMGWVGDSLGTLLYRLAVEYDAVRGEHFLTLTRAQQLGDRVEQEAQRQRFGPTREALLRHEAEREMVTAHLLILGRLKSLNPAKKALGEWAVIQATKRRFMRSDSVVDVITGRVLDAWLDPLCRKCHGRGFNGGYDAPRMSCASCRGTGRRIFRVGKDDEEQAFATFVAAGVDQRLADVEKSIRCFLANRGG